MIYLSRKSNNSNSKTFIKILGIFLVVLFFVVIRFTGIGGSINSLLSPLFSLGDNMYQNINDLPEKFWSKDQLLQEIESLREKEKELDLKLTDISALQFENGELRKSLAIKPEQNFISAFVVARPPQTSFDTLLIDKGIESGVKIGDLILASNSVMIGKIVEVKKDSSIVLLNSSPSAYFAANISRNNEPIEIFGHGSANLYSKLPINVDIEVGDTIILNYGKVFSIGVVEKIENEETSGFKHVFLSLPVNISSLGLVFVSSYINTVDSSPTSI